MGGVDGMHMMWQCGGGEGGVEVVDEMWEVSGFLGTGVSRQQQCR